MPSHTRRNGQDWLLCGQLYRRPGNRPRLPEQMHRSGVPRRDIQRHDGRVALLWHRERDHDRRLSKPSLERNLQRFSKRPISHPSIPNQIVYKHPGPRDEHDIVVELNDIHFQCLYYIDLFHN